ncbi:MAG: AarF/ABC1/UbiB kinase family protein [Leptolyngbyaceae cyanobacterium SM1_1_3]|nr:AarF/ABC1/UbiB kinase family protein [Leptolyngbyaceae cyanobacterium SM1_1_3]NJN03509.1 AarF/ABC1/UbiB kinase family protein [Leptolyngbyaceae cyanobacterium RM1_1_2]NJO12035.1 AarF/ABC1/UbiB kinase family protein [Leptolyngbyaceae cyanobacterium SL_1_1]
MLASLSMSRQGEIIEVVLGHGWDYMRRLLTGGKADEPDLPPPAVLRNILTELGPVYVKLGQLLSTRPDVMPQSYIEELSTLQSTVPAVPAVEMETYIRRTLGRPPEEVFASLDYKAIAAGSIAQTHKATLRDGRQVAIKVQRPGIDTLVARDVSLIRDIARLVSATQFGQRYNVQALAEEFINALEAELDFTTEAAYTDQLRRNLSKSRWFDPAQLVVPEVYWELTNKKIMTMEWLDGKSFLSAEITGKNYDGNIQAEREALTTLLFRAFLQQYFLDGFFHADPHPGNLFYLSDGRVAILDCGMMGRMNPRLRVTLTEMVLAMVNSDAERCAQLTLQIAEPMQPVDVKQLETDYSRLLGKYYGLSLEEFNTAQMFSELMQSANRNHLRWPADIGLYSKSLANLEGVARQFNPKVDMSEEIKPLMFDLFRQQIVGDDPVQTLLRTGLELRNLSIESPRQFGFLLDRLSSETLKWNINIQGLDSLRRNIDDAANRRSFSTVVGSLIIGAAIVSTSQQTSEGQILSNILFAAASLFGLWLMVSILRSGRVR